MSDLEAIQAVEEYWPTALANRDRAWLEAHTTEDFVCIDSNGMMDRARYVDHRSTENETIIEGRNVVELLELVGDTALLVNRAEFLVEGSEGGRRTVRVLGSNVYRRVGATWRVALLHLSEHSPGPGWGEPLLDTRS